MSSSLTKGLRRSTSRSKAKPSAKRAVKAKSSTKPKARRATAAKAPARQPLRAAKKTTAAKAKPKARARTATPKPAARKAAAKKVAISRVNPRVKTTQKLAAVRATRPAPTPPPPRPPTQDESAALVAFERAHKEFVRGRFAEARNQFRVLVDKYSQVAEVAAQEMFERALKREPEAAHIHYGLAATRARLGSIDLALESLEKALNLQPNLRVRAQHDHDLTPLRNDPDFDRLIFSNPS